VADSFYSNIILENRWRLIVDGLKLTILISIFAALLGTILGGLVCYMRMSRNRLLSGAAAAYISLLRGTPVLILLMIIYYIVFASVNINPAIVAVFAFGLNFGAYVSEMFRTSIQSVDKGQMEAGIAGGFTKVQTFVHIVFPQALRHLLPVYKGEFIHRIRSLEHRIASPNYDLYALQAEMEAFCVKHMLPKKVTGYVVHVMEEVLVLQRDFTDIQLSLSYSEKDGSLELGCESAGAPFNPLAEGREEDEIAIWLVKARCSATEYRYEEGKNVLTLRIRGE
jgi:His/Glu/Gln/Arg/opine family amino acid ABC transporter permease subunit